MNMPTAAKTISQPHFLDVDQLSAMVHSLITLERADEPLVSCYFDCSDNTPPHIALTAREGELSAVAELAQRPALADAFAQVRDYLMTELSASTRGVAVFARAGARPMFRAMQFRVRVPTHVAFGDAADIYHLVEVKDTYDRYVVFIAGDRFSRIIEVNLGAVTRELWTKRPELRRHVVDQWAHEVYLRRRRERDLGADANELVLLEKLVKAGGHGYLILAGPPRRTAVVREQLPGSLRDRLVDTCAVPAFARVEDIVARTLQSFVDAEHKESHDAAAQVVEGIRRGGPVVAGAQASIDAICARNAELLVLAQAYPSTPAWQCRACHWIDVRAARPEECATCGTTNELRAVDCREGFVRLAERYEVEIELVAGCEPLMRIGGVGCLLRYPLSDKAWPIGYQE